MSMLQKILEDMWIDPELLEELTKEQKEVLFHKIREEQIRRYLRKAREIEDFLEKNPRKPPALKWSEYADIWDDTYDEKKAAEAEKRATELQKQREQAQMEEEARQARILAEIQIQEAMEKQQAEANRRAEELRKMEEEEQNRLAEEAEKERIAAQEREQYMTMKEARLAAEKEAKARAEREARLKKLAEQRKKEELEREKKAKEQEKKQKKEIETRQSEIYQTMQTVREQAKKTKESEEARLEKNFLEQEKIAKKAEEEQRKAAMKARELAKQQQQATLEKTMMETISARKESVPKKPPVTASMKDKKGSRASMTADTSGNPEARASRPTDENAVVQWFRNDQLPRGVGRSPDGRFQKWFHGMISRPDAEQLLAGQPVGAFLIRVSTRIWGYTLSFVDAGERFKHFLIDAEDGTYSVFGTQARNHLDLNTLVKFHQAVAVSKSGTLLSKPIGDINGNKSLAPLVNF